MTIPSTSTPRRCGPHRLVERGGVGRRRRHASINLPVLPGTSDALWLRGFHAVVPAAIAGFRPQIVISQCGADNHRDDPLADLALTVDGQRAAYLAMRELADRYAEGRWLAVGGADTGLVRVVPRSWDPSDRDRTRP